MLLLLPLKGVEPAAGTLTLTVTKREGKDEFFSVFGSGGMAGRKGKASFWLGVFVFLCPFFDNSDLPEHSFGGYGKISGKCLVLRDSEKTVSLGAFVGLLNRRGFIGN